MTSILLTALLAVGNVSAHSGHHQTHRNHPDVVHNQRNIRPVPVRHHRWVWVSGHWRIRAGKLIWVSGHWDLRRARNSKQHRHYR